MLEDSINCSPPKNERSIHISRMHRKNKRRRVGDSVPDHGGESNVNALETTISGTMQDYNQTWSDSTWEEELNKSCDLNTTFAKPQPKPPGFDPFVDEKLLALADRLDSSQTQHRNKKSFENVRTNQGFVNCSQLMEMQEINPIITPTAGIRNSTEQFGLTESELFKCCAEAEDQVRTTNIDGSESKPPPMKQKSIVETILEDFDCSIDSPNEEVSCSPKSEASSQRLSPKVSPGQEDRSPKLRIENKPLRTYSRRNKGSAVGANIAKLFDTAALAAKREEDDDISSCSSHLSTTEYQSQLPNSPSHNDDLNESIHFSGSLLKLTTTLSQRCTMPDETLEEKSVEVISTDPEKSVGGVQKDHLESFQRNSEMVLPAEIKQIKPENLKACSNVLANQRAPENIEEVPTTSKSVPVISSGGTGIRRNDKSIDEDIFKWSENEDDWNDDCNFFKNFHTQDIFWGAFATNKEKNKEADEFQGFTTASQKPIIISDKAKQRAAYLLAAVDAELESEFQATQNISVSKPLRKEVLKKKSSVTPVCVEKNDKFLSPLNPVTKSSAVKNTANVKESNCAIAHDLGNMQLSEWFIDEPTEQSEDEENRNDEQLCGQRNSQNGSKITGPLQGIESNSILKEAVYVNKHAPNTQATEKSITNLSRNSSDVESSLPANFGFFTASQKPIQISAEALAKAALIFETLPDFPKGMPEELSSNENDVEKWNKTAESKMKAKRKLEPDESIPPDNIEQSTKIFCKAHSSNTASTLRSPQTTPGSNYKNRPLSASFSHNVPQKENFMLTSCLKSATPVRKNLLTLGKQKKVEIMETPPERVKLITNEKLATELTPLKKPNAQSCFAAAAATPLTPNVAEFFSSIPNTSTPQVPQKHSPKTQSHSDTSKGLGEMETDFQRIDWETCNDTSTSNKTDTSSISLKTVQTNEASNTSLKAKIERLCVYDNPPPLSPLAMPLRNNCRPLGLRRGRSLMKHT